MIAKIEDLEWLYPYCTVCDDYAVTDGDGDSLWCDKCGTTWDKDGTGGAPAGVNP